ncbi:hypothetical protein R11007_00068 [Ralstonia holmesii]|uniref:Uncharacterized protein n=1 Tax=Ralstonia holmesii TaxID=3058602 RepID=A0ABC8QHP9_9RALS|nr:hypothetical protein R11007_00068 [Ralstonia sp. LMG 32967]CAJ0804031.1 hypothetical protein LMG18096_04384 [Ralstonia sp. LMG 32967]CAJ0820275.1 hypothetical protein LMG18093_04311 [Ralstonia sp. LMG 32967]
MPGRDCSGARHRHENRPTEKHPAGLTDNTIQRSVPDAVARVLALHAAVLFSVVAAGVGAYIGSLAGAMLATRDEPNPAQPHDATLRTRHSGVLLAARVTPEREAEAARILASAGGMDVEEAAGRWRNGEWVDFDPLSPAKLNPKIAQRAA